MSPEVVNKRRFSIVDFADSHFESALPSDEISLYNNLDISSLRLDRSAFMEEDFAAVKF